MSAVSFIGDLLGAFAESFEPLEESLLAGENLSAFLADFGWYLDPASDINQLKTILGKLPGDLQALPQVIAELDNASKGNQLSAIGDAVDKLATSVKDIVNTINALSNTQPNAVWPAPLNSQLFWTTFSQDLLEYLFYRYLEGHVPKLFAPLRLIGVLSEDHRVPIATGRVAYTRRGVRWDRLISAVSHPEDILANVYGWGGAFEAHRLINNLQAVGIAFGLPATVRQPSREILDAYYDQGAASRREAFELSIPLYWAIAELASSLAMVSIELAALPIPPAGNRSAPAVGLALYPIVLGDADARFPITPDVSAELTGGFVSEALVRAELRPAGASVSFDPSVASVDASVTIDGKPATPWILLGDAASSRLELSHVHAAMKGQGDVKDVELIIEIAADSGAVVLDFSEGDGFLQTVLGGSPQRIPFGVGLKWSSKKGLRFNGQVGFEASIPINQSVAGVISVDTLYVSFKASGDGSGASLVASVDGGLSIGPVAANIERVGVTFDLKPIGSGQPAGNLGLLNLGFGFKPPNGLGLALDATGATGVGFLQFDLDHNRYLGAVALEIADISIEAVGVLTLKTPGGPNFSLVVVAAATFPPVELGFGFSLAGIGGLIGINRTVDVPGIQALARSGRLDDLMFPSDLVHNAPQVAANLGALFPTAESHFLIGPAVRLEWGTEGILDAEIGVFIELSDAGGGIAILRVALLGWFHLTLPQAEAPVADIKLDVLGLLDIPAKMISIDAGLRDSKVAGMTLTGQAALRASWGSNPAFVLAIGGFNPHFAAPAGFPALARVTLSLGDDNPRLRMSTYLALTSNTLQLGASADLYASEGPAAVTASLSFDALVQFKPFGLIVDLSISAAILFDNSPLMSLYLDLHLTGPDPWHVTGKASFQIVFWTVSVPINIMVGTAAPPAVPQTVDLDGNLSTALMDLHSWQTGPPPGGGPVVIRGLDHANPAVHPMGTLTVRQRAVPLAQRIDRYGPDLLDQPCRYAIGHPLIGSAPAQGSDVTDFFAPGQFMTLSDAEKLSAPSFESFVAGMTIGTFGFSLPSGSAAGGGGNVLVDTLSTRQWDLLSLDSPDPGLSKAAVASGPAGPMVRATSGTTTLPQGLIAVQQTGSAAAIKGVIGQGSARFTGRPTGIALKQPTYAVLGSDLAVAAPDGTRFPQQVSSQAAARSALPRAGAQVVYTSEIPGGVTVN